MRGLPLLAAMALLALAGCAPPPSPGASSTPGQAAALDAAPQPTPAAAPPSTTAPTSPEAPVPPAQAADPAPPGNAGAATGSDASAAPAAPSLACRVDADCAVKDVGSCCGYRPACVNADAETFPEQVKARCADEGRMGVCGFAPVSACQCVAGRCAARPETLGPAPPQALQ